MKTFKRLILFILISLPLVAPVVLFAEDDPPKEFVMGYSLKTFHDMNINDVKVSLDLWGKEVGQTDDVIVKSLFYENSDLLIKDFLQKKLDYAVLNSIDFLLLKRAAEYDLAFSRFRKGKKTEKYLILVSADSSVSDISDLRDKKISIVKGVSLGNIFLDTLLLKLGDFRADTFFSNKELRDKPSQPLLSVFFEQADTCLVTDTLFNTMSELNPQIKDQLKVIASSEEFIIGFGVFRKDYNEEDKNNIINKIHDFNNSHRGRQILLLFKSERFELVDESEMKTAEALLREYEYLTNEKL